MPVFEFGVWSTDNLLPDPGPPPSQSIATNQTNGNQQIGDTFTIGTQDSEIIVIEDNENGVFEDDTDTPQFLDQPLTIGGFSYPAGTQVQNEFYLTTDQVDSNGDPILIIVLRFQPPTGGLTTTAYTLTAPLPDGTTFTITGAVNNPTGPGSPPYPDFICFAAGTMIQIAGKEEIPIESLVPGDLVATLDNGLQPVRWVGCRTLDAVSLYRKPKLRPIRIKAGALAEGVPERDLVVSPQHRLFLRSKIATRMFDTNEVLIHARHLLGMPGVAVAEDMETVTYVHAMCDDHEIIEANGALAETLYTGTEAMKAMSRAANREIDEIFGEAPYLDRSLARPTPVGKLSRKLIQRHVKNGKPLVPRFFSMERRPSGSIPVNRHP